MVELLRSKMFNIRRYLNPTAVQRFAPLINTVIQDMSDDDLKDAASALNQIDQMILMEQDNRAYMRDTVNDYPE